MGLSAMIVMNILQHKSGGVKVVWKLTIYPATREAERPPAWPEGAGVGGYFVVIFLVLDQLE